MKFTATPLEGSYIITPIPHTDSRGWFARTYCRDEFASIGHQKDWLQMNHSFTTRKGTVRGMHYQDPPFTEVKLVRCVSGAAYDVIVDLRRNSSTFLQWFGAELSGENMLMMYVPEGFAHGFQTLTDNCTLVYNHSSVYVPGSEKGVRYDDPAVGIGWPLPATLLSERDLQHPLLTPGFSGVELDRLK